MFDLIHKSRTVSRHIHFNPGQILDCGAFPFDTQFQKSVKIESKFNFDGLFIIGEVNSKTNVHLYAANLSSKMQSATYVLAVILHEWKVLKLRKRYKVKLQVVHLTGYTIYDTHYVCTRI
ncbi:hypothetical protein H5410_016798 [Solanum commersonii]|uniref:Uncharacterized protein n=1 Tax=Solanum commersonii TaxID=4109 RepID=A0A9J5ZXC3_SOLCO|nr:hypothetical protein H5410_016798 [Solanum commersonii]